MVFFEAVSLTVVDGLRRTVDCFTNRPVIALRPRLPLVLDCLGMRIPFMSHDRHTVSIVKHESVAEVKQ